MDFNECLEYINKRIDEINNKIAIENKKMVSIIQDNVTKIPEYVDELYNRHLSKLDSLVGLKEVKQEIRKLINYLIFINKINTKVKLDNINLNMMFRGNPGTGKTTVARIVANILWELGFLTTNKVIETTPRDFVAGYVGQTALKAKSLIDKAKGGIIFIDEAYTFAQSADESGHTFTYEAITEIIKEMENKNTIFIFSGYSKEMDDFVKLNPGIKSRIGYDIEFKNYTKEELLAIFNKKVEKTGMHLSHDAKEVLLEKIEEKMKNKNFGNGRMIDNLFDEVIREHATRNLYEIDEEKLLLITKESIQNIETRKEGGMCFG